MKRWRLAIAVLIVVALSSYVYDAFAKRARQKREAVYQQTLLSYSEVLKPGMTRKEVEGYLRTKDISVLQMGLGMPMDLVKIGDEEVPWWCTGGDIYVRFRFIPRHEPAQQGETSPSELDTLAEVDIYRLVGCLN